MKLIKVVKSEKSGKKFTAYFDKDGRTIKRSFGAAGMDDFTRTHDTQQRSRYRSRHSKDLKGDPTKPGYLSYYILWGPSTSMKANIAAYKRKFSL